MNLQQLATFCKVLSEGSMTAAADKLFLTQPAVSQQIRALEEEMGVSLLVRGVRQVKPTMQGQLLYDYAKRILHLTQQAEVAIQTMSQEIQGNLTVGTTNSIGLYLVSPIIGLFLKHNNNLNIKLVYGNYTTIIDEMKKGAIDVVILPDLLSEFGIEFSNYESKFLMKDEMWLVGSGRDTSLPAKIDLKSYGAKPVVIHSSMYPGFRRVLSRELEDLKVDYRPVFETDNVGTLKRVIESGLGWGFMPSHSIYKQVRTRRMTHVQVDNLSYSVNINMYHMMSQEMQKKADVFFRAIQQQAISQL